VEEEHRDILIRQKEVEKRKERGNMKEWVLVGIWGPGQKLLVHLFREWEKTKKGRRGMAVKRAGSVKVTRKCIVVLEGKDGNGKRVYEFVGRGCASKMNRSVRRWLKRGGKSEWSKIWRKEGESLGMPIIRFCV